MFCPKCGAENIEAKKFCRHCGSKLVFSRSPSNLMLAFAGFAAIISLAFALFSFRSGSVPAIARPTPELTQTSTQPMPKPTPIIAPVVKGTPAQKMTTTPQPIEPPPTPEPQRRVVNVNPREVQQRAVKKVDPIYPPDARAGGVQGTVAIRVTISETGDVIDAVAMGGPPSLRDAALEAAKQWKWQTSQEPVVVNRPLFFKFTLSDTQGARTEHVSFGTEPNSNPAPSAAPSSVVNDNFWLSAGKYQYYEFRTPHAGTLSGRIREAYGRDIEFFVMDYSNFENWANGRTGHTYYNAGRIVLKEFAVELNPGRYVLVFSNNYSIITGKQVEAQVSFMPFRR